MLIIFDWDGTLVDSAGKIVQAMQEAIDVLGMPSRTADDVREIIGLGLPEAIHALFPEHEAAEREQLRQRYADRYVELDAVPCKLFPGAEAVLAALVEDGHQLAVATGKSRRGLDRVLLRSGLAGYFSATRCADETRSKPDPLMLHQLLSYFGRSTTEALMVGDSEYDMAMAHNAQMPRMAVSYGVHAAERLARFQPVATVHSLYELLAWTRQ